VKEPTVGEIGDLLMGRYVLPLEIMGLLLTAALIGAVLLAMKPGGNVPAKPIEAKPATVVGGEEP